MTPPASRINTPQFLRLVEQELGKRPDRAQLECLRAPAQQSLFILAGPGTGKTTTVTLRILRLIFVDEYDPGSILATTFTNRAADELRSRILGWGTTLRQAFTKDKRVAPRLDALDINRIVTGTLDSISQDALTTFRAPGAIVPVVLEQFAADALMTHRALLDKGRYNSTSLRGLVQQLRGSARPVPFNDLRNFCAAARDRMAHDRVDEDRYRRDAGGANRGSLRLCELLDDYADALRDELAVDFAGLEQAFLARLRDGSLHTFLEPLRAVFVDEYQDTNFLQESIYFEITRRLKDKDGSITVVGDDDQSLYRFRGATVDLFQAFSPRLERAIRLTPKAIYLSNNYRSTSNVVDFCDSYVRLDSQYERVRAGSKPRLRSARDASSYINYPVLGLFRPSLDDVSEAIADTIDQIFNRGAFRVPGTRLAIEPASGGSISDCAVLCSSPRERDYRGRSRLPLVLRQNLANLAQPVHVFNPRGIAFNLVPEVQVLGGLLLECIDPGSRIQDGITTLPRDARGTLAAWRQAGADYQATDPGPRSPRSLSDFVRAWQRRRATSGTWPDEVPLAELLYKLATWIPMLVKDVEGLVYLEVFARTITEATRVVTPIFLSDPTYSDGRVRRLIREIFLPLASGSIDVDEDLLETLPGDRLSVFSIHQAKGLEFPMVVVDVGCHYPDNRSGPAQRFPRAPGLPHNMEDHFRRYSKLKPPRRSGLNRAFDDLARQYFVAYSRAKEVLLLAGLGSPTGGPLGNVKNIATGWTRDESAGLRWNDLPHVHLI